MIRHNPNPGARAFTMVEVMLAVSILSVAVLAILQTIVSSHMHADENRHQFNAAFLAESLAEEVLAHPYLDPDGDEVAGPDNGEGDRSRFDAIDDFHGYQQPAGDLRDAQGELLDDSYQAFTRDVTVTYGTTSVNTVAGSFLATGAVVEVVVSDNRNRTLTLTRFVPEPIR